MKIVLTTVPVERTPEPDGVFRVSIAVGFLSDDTPLTAPENNALWNWPSFLEALETEKKLTFCFVIDGGGNPPIQITEEYVKYDWENSPWDDGLWRALVWNKEYTALGENTPPKEIMVNKRPANREWCPVAFMPTTDINYTLEDLYNRGVSNHLEYLEGNGFLNNLSQRFDSDTIIQQTVYQFYQRLDPLKWEAQDATKTPKPPDLQPARDNLSAAYKKLVEENPDAATLLLRNLQRISRNELTNRAQSLVEGIVLDACNKNAGFHPLDEVAIQFLRAAIFHRRIPNPNPGVRLVGAENAKRKFADPNREMDVFERIALLRNYPTHSQDKGLADGIGLLRSLGLTIDLRFTLPPRVALTDQKFIRVVAKFDGLPAPICPKTCFLWDSDSMFRAADRPDESWLTEGFLKLADADHFKLITLDCDGASHKIAEVAKNVANTEGAQVFTESAYPFKIIKLSCNSVARQLIDNAPDKVEDIEKLLESYGADLDKLKMQFRRLGVKNSEPFADPQRVWEEIHFDVNLTFKSIGKTSSKVIARSVRAGNDRVYISWQLYEDGVYREPASPGLPAPRSGGIALAWKTRPQRIKDVQKRTAEIAGKAQDAVLYAADLILGYVPEVFLKHPRNSELDRWLSLTARYETFPGIPARYNNRLTNGVMRLPTARTLDNPDHLTGADVDDLHVGEIVFSWEGWSLGVERQNSGVLLQDSKTLQKKSPSQDRWGVIPEIMAHEVPPLRFVPPKGGAKYMGIYRFRVRTVDLAGNQAKDSKNAELISDEIPYRRYEPVPSPELLLDRRPSEHRITKRGISRMVVRAGYETDTRWVVPPRTSLSMAESHGLLDRAANLDNVESFEDIALTSDGDFPVVKIDDPPHFDPVNPHTNTNVNAGENYPIRLPHNASGRRIIPYFPDPLARGVKWALEYLASDENSPRQTKWLSGEFIPFYPHSRWPRAQAFQIVLKSWNEHQPGAHWSKDNRILTIHLPPGFSAKLHLSSSLEKTENLSVLKLGANLLEAKGEAKLMNKGGEFVPLLVGTRTVELINAVQQPNLPPYISSIHRQGESPGESQTVVPFERVKDDVKADLEFDVHAEVQSTGKLRFIASWEGPASSDKDGVSPIRVQGRADLGEIQLEEWLGGNRWIAGKGMPSIPFQRFQHALPDTGFRVVDYHAVGTTRFLEYFEDVKNKEALELVGAPKKIAILNCAQPPAPEFAYLVPAFEWKHFTSGNKFHSERKGLFRLFFSGPWDITGDDEMVGISLWKDQQTPINDAERKKMRRWATCWGLDPIRPIISNPAAGAGPKAADFGGFTVFAAGEIVNLPALVKKLNHPPNGNSLTTYISKNLLRKTRESLRRYSGRRDSDGSDFLLQKDLASDFERFIRGDSFYDQTRDRFVTLKKINREQFQHEFPSELLLSDLLGQDGAFLKRKLPKPDKASPDVEVNVIPYRPEFDEKRKIWYCDVQLGNLPAEYAFVRFALTRFQPHSLSEPESWLSISKVILVDFAQVAPGRYLTVYRKGAKQLQVQLMGDTTASEADRNRFKEPPIILKQDEKSSDWIEDKNIHWENDTPISDNLLLSGCFTWPNYTGPRRLVVREKNVGTASFDPAAFETYPYMDILDV